MVIKEENLCENTQLPKGVLGFVVYFIKRYKFAIIIALLITFFRNEGSLFLSNYVLKYVIDGLSAGKLTFKITMICFFVYALIFYSGLLCDFLLKIIKLNSIAKAQNNIKNVMFQYLMKHSVSFFSNNFTGAIDSKINYLSNGIEKLFSSFIDIFGDFVGFIILLAVFSAKSLMLGIFSIFWLICYASLFIYFSKRIEKTLHTKQVL